MAALREPLVRGETMAARPGNDADGRRTTPSRAGALLRALTLAAFAAGIWCLVGTTNAFAGEHVAFRHTAHGVDAAPGAPSRARASAFLPPVAPPFRSVSSASVVPSGDSSLPALARWAGGELFSPGVDPVTLSAAAVLREVRERATPERLLSHVVPAAPGLLPWPGRASRGGPPRAGLVPPGSGPAPRWSTLDSAAVAPPRTAPRADPVPFSDDGVPCATASGLSRPAAPAHPAAVPRYSGTATVSSDRDPGSGIDKTPGLCALAHETPAPAAPPCSSWVASRIVPALCLRASEPPVSPD